MKQNQNEHLSQEAIRIHHLVKQLNQYRHEYYNMNAPSVSDAVYDCLFDELDALEKRTGIILSNSPTQTVGYQAVSQLDKVHHPIPLLSLDKTKQITEIHDFMKKQKSLLMLKLDGLTIKLTYENGRLIEASTRGKIPYWTAMETLTETPEIWPPALLAVWMPISAKNVLFPSMHFMFWKDWTNLRSFQKAAKHALQHYILWDSTSVLFWYFHQKHPLKH